MDPHRWGLQSVARQEDQLSLDNRRIRYLILILTPKRSLTLSGTGKSYLTTRLISWGSYRISRLAYFYFRDNNPETRSVLQALRDVAYQLSESDPFYAKQLLRGIHSIDEIRTIPSAYRKLFVQ